jgi:hypothetical protein
MFAALLQAFTVCVAPGWGIMANKGHEKAGRLVLPRCFTEWVILQNETCLAN